MMIMMMHGLGTAVQAQQQQGSSRVLHAHQLQLHAKPLHSSPSRWPPTLFFRELSSSHSLAAAPRAAPLRLPQTLDMGTMSATAKRQQETAAQPLLGTWSSSPGT